MTCAQDILQLYETHGTKYDKEMLYVIALKVRATVTLHIVLFHSLSVVAYYVYIYMYVVAQDRHKQDSVLLL